MASKLRPRRGGAERGHIFQTTVGSVSADSQKLQIERGRVGKFSEKLCHILLNSNPHQIHINIKEYKSKHFFSFDKKRVLHKKTAKTPLLNQGTPGLNLKIHNIFIDF